MARPTEHSPEIEVTPEMIEAAADTLATVGVAQDLLQGFTTPEAVAEAMLRAAMKSRAKAHAAPE
jgi:hypothetical protein